MFSVFLLILPASCRDKGFVMTVNGPISSKDMGVTLIHEHVLVEFRSSDTPGYLQWDTDEVISRVLPYLQEIKALGCQTFIECTPV
jgi:phosphotriesterase-related protein